MKVICNNLAMMLYLLVFAALGTDQSTLAPYDDLDDDEKESVLGSPIAFLNIKLQAYLDKKGKGRPNDKERSVAQRVKDKLNGSRALSVIFPFEAGSNTRYGLMFENEEFAQRLLQDAFDKPDSISKERLARYHSVGIAALRAAIAVNEGAEAAMRMIPIVPVEVKEPPVTEQ